MLFFLFTKLCPLILISQFSSNPSVQDILKRNHLSTYIYCICKANFIHHPSVPALHPATVFCDLEAGNVNRIQHTVQVSSYNHFLFWVDRSIWRGMHINPQFHKYQHVQTVYQHCYTPALSFLWGWGNCPQPPILKWCMFIQMSGFVEVMQWKLEKRFLHVMGLMGCFYIPYSIMNTL